MANLILKHARVALLRSSLNIRVDGVGESLREELERRYPKIYRGVDLSFKKFEEGEKCDIFVVQGGSLKLADLETMALKNMRDGGCLAVLSEKSIEGKHRARNGVFMSFTTYEDRKDLHLLTIHTDRALQAALSHIRARGYWKEWYPLRVLLYAEIQDCANVYSNCLSTLRFTQDVVLAEATGEYRAGMYGLVIHGNRYYEDTTADEYASMVKTLGPCGVLLVLETGKEEEVEALIQEQVAPKSSHLDWEVFSSGGDTVMVIAHYKSSKRNSDSNYLLTDPTKTLGLCTKNCHKWSMTCTERWGEIQGDGWCGYTALWRIFQDLPRLSDKTQQKFNSVVSIYKHVRDPERDDIQVQPHQWLPKKYWCKVSYFQRFCNELYILDNVRLGIIVISRDDVLPLYVFVPTHNANFLRRTNPKEAERIDRWYLVDLSDNHFELLRPLPWVP